MIVSMFQKALKVVEIKPDLSYLTDNQRKVISYLIKVSDIIRDLYLFQKNPLLLAELKNAKESGNLKLVEKIYALNDGYNVFDNLPLIEGYKETDVFGFYPPDLSVQDFQKFISTHPDIKDDFISPYTVIIRNKEKELQAVAYSEYYKNFLEEASAILSEATEFADNFYLKSYLHALSNAFLNNDFNEAAIRWIQLTGNDIEPLLGPHEIYDDKLLGYKASFTAFIGLNNREQHVRLNELLNMSPVIQSLLPIPVNYKKSSTEKKSTIQIVDLLYSSGDGSGPIHTAAFNLPNSQKIRNEFGSKKVFFRNVIKAKFDNVMCEIANTILSPDDVEKVSFEAYFNHILLHEISHSLGVGMIKDENGEWRDISYFIKDLYGVLEETKADVMGLFSQFYLIKQSMIIDATVMESSYSYLVGLIRSIRFGMENAHGLSALIQWNFLLIEGAFSINKESLSITLNLHKIEKSIEQLLTLLLTLQGEGDYNKTELFVKKYSFKDDELEKIISLLKGISVDILPVFLL